MENTTTETAKDLSPEVVAAIKSLTKRGYKVRTSSGKGMFGQYCLAVEVSRDIYPKIPKLRGVASRSDCLGMDFIVYWPTLKTPEKLPEMSK